MIDSKIKTAFIVTFQIVYFLKITTVTSLDDDLFKTNEPLQNVFSELSSDDTIRRMKYSVHKGEETATICWNEKTILHFYKNGTSFGYVQYAITLELVPQDSVEQNQGIPTEQYEIRGENSEPRVLDFVTVKSNDKETVKVNRTFHCKSDKTFISSFADLGKRKRVEIKMKPISMEAVKSLEENEGAARILDPESRSQTSESTERPEESSTDAAESSGAAVRISQDEDNTEGEVNVRLGMTEIPYYETVTPSPAEAAARIDRNDDETEEDNANEEGDPVAARKEEDKPEEENANEEGDSIAARKEADKPEEENANEEGDPVAARKEQDKPEEENANEEGDSIAARKEADKPEEENANEEGDPIATRKEQDKPEDEGITETLEERSDVGTRLLVPSRCKTLVHVKIGIQDDSGQIEEIFRELEIDLEQPYENIRNSGFENELSALIRDYFSDVLYKNKQCGGNEPQENGLARSLDNYWNENPSQYYSYSPLPYQYNLNQNLNPNLNPSSYMLSLPQEGYYVDPNVNYYTVPRYHPATVLEKLQNSFSNGLNKMKLAWNKLRA